MSIEELAVELVSDPQISRLAPYAVLLVGFLIALGRRQKSVWTLRRLLYFVYFTLIILAYRLIAFLHLAANGANEHGLVWLMLCAEVFSFAAIGYLLGVISHGRSVSAFGHGRHAWMGIVPLVNLVLFFKKAIEPSGPRNAQYIIGVAAGIAIGLSILFLTFKITQEANQLSISSTSINWEAAEQTFLDAAQDPNKTPLLEGIVRLAEASEPSGRDAKGLGFARSEAMGITLRKVFYAQEGIRSVLDDPDADKVSQYCELPQINSLLAAGIVVQVQFLALDETELGSYMLNRETCATQFPATIAAANGQLAVSDLESLLQTSNAEYLKREYNNPSFIVEGRVTDSVRQQIYTFPPEDFANDTVLTEKMYEFYDARLRSICLSPTHLAFLQAGATYVDTYLLFPREYLISFTFDRTTCEEYANAR
jgi:hypothetical protein